MPAKFSEGILIFIESDEKGIWWQAKKWQADTFISFMRFGTMKSMGMPNPHVVSNVFKEDGFKYRIHVHNDWGPCYLENVNTKKKREIKYYELYKNNNVFDRYAFPATIMY